MRLWEKALTIFGAVYVTLLIVLRQVSYRWLYVLGLVLGIACVIVTIRDLLTRRFEKPNRKSMWALILVLGGTPGWILYLVLHGFRPRN